ncbi:MAG: transglutaminase family protein, partial [Variovorax sp.]|nr:transglutaminase family protein [Variovorax sp.]
MTALPEAMHLSHIDARLSYEVAAPAHLLLNIEAADAPTQTVLSEALTIEPPTAMQVFCDAGSGNRFIRFDAAVGPLRIAYRATVRRASVHVPTGLPEVPVNQVPDDVLHYLMPTRYCESDLMARCAQQLF